MGRKREYMREGREEGRGKREVKRKWAGKR